MARIVLINAGPWLTVPPQGYGGIESVIATLIPELRRNGVYVVLATVAASTIKVDEKIAVFPTPQFAHLTEPYNEVMGVAAAHMHHVVTWLQNRIDVDLVHDHLEVLGLTVLAAAGRTVPPVLHTLHWDLARRPTLYRNFQGAGRIWVNGVSSAQMAQAPAQLRACSLGHAHLASPLAQNASKRPPSAKCDHLVLVARITAVKGQHVAVRVAQRLGCELVLAGPVGPYQTSDELAADPHADRYPDVRYYREKVAPYVDGEQIRWVGNVIGVDRDDLVATARATLFPASWDEPGGTAVIESLALGTPVVGYGRGCLPELVEPGTGLLAEPDNEPELAHLLTRIDEIDQDHCRAVAERRFAPTVMATAYLQLYDKCLLNTDRMREIVTV